MAVSTSVYGSTVRCRSWCPVGICSAQPLQSDPPDRAHLRGHPATASAVTACVCVCIGAVGGVLLWVRTEMRSGQHDRADRGHAQLMGRRQWQCC
eukprot:3494262-Rhodomonas_salina.3